MGEGRRLGAAGRGRLLPQAVEDAAQVVEQQVGVVDVTAETAERAMSAWRRYGKGRHPAGLDFGDCFSYALACFSYALADQRGLPLLCTGEDFAVTDLEIIR